MDHVTTADHVRIAGTSSEWDADIKWVNTGGGSGHTWPHYEGCLTCRYDWAIEVPLAHGENVVSIIATVYNSSSQQTITIRRDEPGAQWAWIR